MHNGLLKMQKRVGSKWKAYFFASFLFLLAEYSFAEELTNYTITSDSQINTLEGDLEAIATTTSR